MARKRRGDFLTRQAGTGGGGVTRRILIGVGIAFGVLLILVVCAYLYLMSWLQGDSCRSLIESRIQQATQAQRVSVPEPLQVDGANLALSQITIHRTGYFDELKINKLHVGLDRSALWKRILRTRQFSAEELKLEFYVKNEHPDKASSPSRKAAEPGKHSVTGGTGARGKTSRTACGDGDGHDRGGGLFRDIQLRSFDALYAESTVHFGERFASLRGYRLIAEPAPRNGKNAWTLHIEDGQLVTPYEWLKGSGVKSARAEITGDRIRLSSCHILVPPGNVRANGEYVGSTGEWKIRAIIDRVDSARFLSPDWKKRVSGKLRGDVEFSSSKGKAWQVRGDLGAEDGVLEALPMLSEIKLGQTYPYRSLRLEKATCRLVYPYNAPDHSIRDAWLWDNIDIRSHGGTLLVRGHIITGQDGSLSGTLKIGVPVRFIDSLGLTNTPLARQLFRTQQEEREYLWLHVNLSGTIDDPHEDLTARMEAILPACISELPGKATKVLNKVLDNFLPRVESDTSEDHGEKGKEEEDRTPSSGDKVRDVIKSGIELFL